MRRFRAAIKWWVFLPVAPILIALVSMYSEELFHALGLPRLAWAAHGISIFDCVALLPYMAFASAIFGSIGSLALHDSLSFSC
jgi:hypothetical protein